MHDLAQQRKLTVVSNTLPEPPYASDTKANGWKPELDIQRIKQSKTWVMCPERLRPWLLMLWMEAWESVPAGTFPVGEDEIIAARLGMPFDEFQLRKGVLMSGWYACSDGNYYHPYIVSMVETMISSRAFTRNRKRMYDERQRVDSETFGNNVVSVPSNASQGGSNALQPGSNALQGGSNGAEQEQEQEEKKLLSKSPAIFDLIPDMFGGKPIKTRLPPCPHREIVDLYHTILPEQPGITFSLWLKSKDAKCLEDRWKEDERHRNLDFWRQFFEAVKTNSHWMGGNGNGWRAGLRWLVQKSHFIAGVERMVENRSRKNG